MTKFLLILYFHYTHFMEERLVENKDWIILLLGSIFILLAIVRAKFPRRFREFILLPITNKYFSIEGRSNEVTHPFSVLLFLVQALSFSLFICLLIPIFEVSLENSPMLFLQVFTGYTGLVLTKFYVEKLIAHIVNIEKVVQEYLYEKLSYLNLISIVLFITNLIFYFVYLPNTATLLIILLFFVFLYAIALLSSIKKNTPLILQNFFYFILYLCALEFAPYIILYKLVV
ncbi:MAG: DUF4271 domain-containing protein [Flavobacteriaceae bacterium]